MEFSIIREGREDYPAAKFYLGRGWISNSIILLRLKNADVKSPHPTYSRLSDF